MKCIRIIPALLSLLVLSSCVSDSGRDVNELLKSFDIEASAADFRITRDDEKYRYSGIFGNSLMCIYTDKNGVAVQITLTAEKPDKDFYRLCASSVKAFGGFSESESRTLIKSLQTEKRIEKGKYNLVLKEFDFGTVFLINLSSDGLNTNEYPTLKRPVEKEDISRPTAGAEQTVPLH